MQSAIKDRGVVLRQFKSREADKLVRIFTRSHGVMNFVARGVRRSNSKKSPHLDTLNEIRFESSRGDSPAYLDQVETIHHFRNLKDDLSKIRSGFYLAELILATVPESAADEKIYDRFVGALLELNNASDIRPGLLEFQLFLIDRLGFPPPVNQEPATLISYLEEISEKSFSSRQFKIG